MSSADVRWYRRTTSGEPGLATSTTRPVAGLRAS